MFKVKGDEGPSPVTEETLASSAAALNTAAIFFGSLGNEKVSGIEVAAELHTMAKYFSDWPRKADGSIVSYEEMGLTQDSEAMKEALKVAEQFEANVLNLASDSSVKH